MSATEEQKAEYREMATLYLRIGDTESIELLLEVWDSAAALAYVVLEKRLTNGELIEWLDEETKKGMILRSTLP